MGRDGRAARAGLQEGLAWFDTVLIGDGACQREMEAAVRARAVAGRALLAIGVGTGSVDSAQQAGDRARQAAIIKECQAIARGR